MAKKKKDILKILRHEYEAPSTLRMIEECRERMFDVIWMAANEIEILRNENQELKRKLKQYE
jgi:hypothetical protein